MSRRVLVTGSTTGLGRAAAEALLAAGHRVVVHARSDRRAADLGPLADAAEGVLIGDLAELDDVRRLAADADAIGRFDAEIHNAGIYVDAARTPTRDGHARVVAVNVLAPYVLTALVERPDRLIYLSSGLHRDGDPDVRDLDWTARRWNGMQAYCDTKLQVTALSAAVAARWPGTRANAVDPGWVPTRMGGPNAPDDLVAGHVTQVWLAVADDPDAGRSGRYWHHRRTEAPAGAVDDPAYQQALLDRLADLTGVVLPD